MSLIGIDLGTSAIKVAAYAVDGALLAEARRPVPAHRPAPGQWEVDVSESLAAFREALTTVAHDPRVRADPPRAISFSSSGREVFPAADGGAPLGPCLMTADVRGDEVAARTAARRPADEWFRLTGHLPRRMDPVNRILWWRQTSPSVSAAARWFLNWHEYYSLVLSGIPVADASNAGAWAIYDLDSGTWSADRAERAGARSAVTRAGPEKRHAHRTGDGRGGTRVRSARDHRGRDRGLGPFRGLGGRGSDRRPDTGSHLRLVALLCPAGRSRLGARSRRRGCVRLPASRPPGIRARHPQSQRHERRSTGRATSSTSASPTWRRASRAAIRDRVRSLRTRGSLPFRTTPGPAPAGWSRD